MCGFAGEFLFQRPPADAPGADLGLVQRMAARLAHRGPDDARAHRSDDGRLAMGFRRLAVLDPAGSAQPMSSPDGQCVLAYNGEIYNYRQLRQELTSHGWAFRTRGDTEAVLAGLALHGPAYIARLEGMFALAFYDAARQTLLLARDRLGQKPLVYAVLDDRIVFASELKALLDHPGVQPAMDPQALPMFMCMGYIPGPHTIWHGFRKLPPGCFARVERSTGTPEPYWRLDPSDAPPDATQRHLAVRNVLTQAVRRRTVADVPVGALLSGGIDSAIVAALLTRERKDPSTVRTFTATFDDPAYDEADLARQTAQRLGTHHTQLPVSLDPARAVETMVDLYDEPFADSSAVALHAICAAAREHVTVALVGDGGDEAFAGYDRHRAMWLAKGLRPGRYLLLKVLAALAGPFAPAGERSRLRRFVRFVDGLGHPYSMQYFRYRSLFTPEELPALFADDFAERVALDRPVEWFTDTYEAVEALDEVQQAQYCDYATYLPDDLLVKADIASMACGLELRAPMLDPKVVRLGLGLDASEKVGRRRGKLALREAFAEELPDPVLRGRKRGFGVPLGSWLSGPLRSRVEAVLTEGRLARRGMFRPEALRVLAREQLTGRRDHGHRIWALLVLDEWLSRFGA